LVDSVSDFRKSAKSIKKQKWKNFELLSSRLSIFSKKSSKSEHRGDAEFGTHGCKKN
jgi:hypothetical protein